MNVKLVVLTEGKWEGKTIPITLSQFLIGRDPQCHLRPASPIISKRHCAFLTRKDKVFVRDFDSTNGTVVNDQAIKGEVELKDGDRVTVGPISFRVQLEAAPPAEKPAPAPAVAAAPKQSNDDDSVAEMLMSILDDGGPTPLGPRDAVPEGSTVMDVQVSASGTDPDAPPAKDKADKPPPAANTSTAAKAILDKYMRRPRKT
jgi:pSer/pThr/pTyr-binding forkhead associated (FHA) protein